MSINKFMHNSDGRPFHSSAYARVAYGDTIGSTNQQSFENRTRVDKNRQVVGQYTDSKIVYHGQTEIKGAHTSALPNDKIQVQTHRTRLQVNSRDRRTTPGSNTRTGTVPLKTTYTQPPVRGYDPFG